MSHTSTYWYVQSTYLSCFFLYRRFYTGTYRVHTCLAFSCTDVSTFLKGTYWVHADFGGVCTFGSWIYFTPAGPGCPAGLIASDSGTGPHIESNKTIALAGLFTAAWQHPCQCLNAWRLAWGFSCGVSASPDSQPPWSAVCSPAAPAPARNAVRAANGRVKDLGFKLGVHDELQSIWAILQSSSSGILSQR